MDSSANKGQLNIEFLAAAALFIVTITALISTNQALPSYSSEMNRIDLNLEGETMTNQLLTNPGKHSYGRPNSNWEKNSSTLNNIEAVGLATGHHEVERDKIQALQTTTINGGTGLNYTEFIDITGANNQYRFNFVWLPTIQTNLSYIRGSPPSSPPIIEPKTNSYINAENEVHYGTVDIRGIDYNVLVTAHDGVYDSMYVREENWDFSNSNDEEPYKVGDTILENKFQVESFQNREDNIGGLVIIRKQIKEFGPSVNEDTEIITLDRYAVLENEPLRMEVSIW